MIKKIVLSLLILFLSTSIVNADDKFETNYYIKYELSNTGITNVTEKITLTNKTSEYYPTNQKLSYSFFNILNAKVQDEKGQFLPNVQTKEATTTLDIPFRSKNVGVGKTNSFILTYQTTDIASLNGEVWQILIPGIRNARNYDNFNLEIIIPDSFPEIQYASIIPTKKWIFSKDEIKENGIVLIFGQNQYYKADLKYFLENKGYSLIYQSIAIPPNTNYQNVILTKIKPEPEFAEKDPDGNWIFWYLMKPNEKKTIIANELINVFFNPKQTNDLTKKDIKEYTKPQKYWDYEKFENFSDKISKLKTPKEIYDFTSNFLSYNYDRLNKPPERFTASEALQNPLNSICTDFTNVFIALARKNGIPSREINGFAFAQNKDIQPLSLEKDILHAWPEYYDFNKKTWVMVDPTWGSTTGGVDYFNKLDLNHIAFVTKGYSSESPFPAGSYNGTNRNIKNVNINFISKQEYEKTKKYDSERNNKIEAIVNIDKEQIAGLEKNGQVIIQNKSPTEIYDISVIISWANTKITKNIKSLIPYEQAKYDLILGKSKIWENKNINLEIQINGQLIRDKIKIKAIYLWKNNIYIFASFIFVLLLIFLFFAKLIIKEKKQQKLYNNKHQ